MAITYYVSNEDGTQWTLKKSWPDGFFPVMTMDKDGKFYLFRIYKGNIEMATSNNVEDPNSWSSFTAIISGVWSGDIGATYNPDIGSNGRIFVCYWKANGMRAISYSDNKGLTWTEILI